MRVDSHQHFWKIGRFVYPWMGPGTDAIRRDFLPKDLQPMLKRRRIDKTVLVQTVSSVEETRWFLELARQHSFIAGVVGWVDLTSPTMGQTLDELCKDPNLVGIRHQVHDEPDNEWLLRPDVQRGLRELAKRAIPYDVLIRPQHLKVSLQLARTFPDLLLVVDHIGKPAIAKRQWDDWAKGMAELAQCANVFCKLSGMITEADWRHWKPGDLRPYIQHVIEAFGSNRVMFGSDWPACELAGSYDQVVEAVEVNLAHLSASEREDIFGNNAVQFYHLEKL